MPTVHYHDLPAYGLRIQPAPNGEPLAAELVNESGKTVITMAHAWKRTTAPANVHVSRSFDLGSSLQVDLLSGRADVSLDAHSFLPPGSKRVIKGWERKRVDAGESIAIDLVLDLAIFDDGLCVGPDETGWFQSLVDDFQQQREIAGQIVVRLRKGESVGGIFEILRPFARRVSTMSQGGLMRPIHFFAQAAVHHLIHMTDPDLLSWFKRQAAPPLTTLHRPPLSSAETVT